MGLGNIGGFGSTIYWSSTEKSRDDAWVEHFQWNGYQSYIMTKIVGNYYVRAVRAFPQEAVVAQSSVSDSGDTLYLQDGGSVIIPGISVANLSIGDTYQGGIIFYLDGSGCHGLVAAPSDQSTGIQWHNASYIDTYAYGNGIGSGEGNSQGIRRWQGTCSSCYASQLCQDLNLGGKTDWYLPSKYELNLMYENIGQGNVLGLGNVGNFANYYYWSSTEYGNNFAWRQIFHGGLQPSYNKYNTFNVRAIRAF